MFYEGLYFFSSGRIIGDKVKGTSGSSAIFSDFVIEGRRIYRVKNERRMSAHKNIISKIIFKIIKLPPD